MRYKVCFISAFICFLFVHVSSSVAGTYTVRKGDSLYTISKKFKIGIESIKETNGLSSSRLKPGAKLEIPSREPHSKKLASKGLRSKKAKGKGIDNEAKYHLIKKGETLAYIAKKYSMPLKELKDVNGIKNPKRLKPGQKLLVKKTDSLGGGEGITASETAGVAEEIKALAESPEVKSRDMKEQLLIIARMMLNIPYRFGGSSFRGLDCSAFVQKAFNFIDIFLPRAAREQFNHGEPVSKEELTVGDLVFFRTYASFPSHVGIYIGDNLFIHASSKGKKVTIDSLETPYYIKRFIGAKRLLSDKAGEVTDELEEEKDELRPVEDFLTS